MADSYYTSQRYVQYEKTLDKIDKVDPNYWESKFFRHYLEERLEEESAGKYDLPKIYEDSKFGQRLKLANYRGPIEIKDGKYVATTNIAFDELLMASKSLILGHSQLSRIMQHSCMDPYFRSQLNKIPGIMANDKMTENTVSDLWQRYSINMNPYSEYTGLFVSTSHFTHACVPNTNYYFISDFIFIKANKSIKKGDTITFSHVPVSSCMAERFNKLGGECDCELCLLEKNDMGRFTNYQSMIHKNSSVSKSSRNKSLDALRAIGTDIAKLKIAQILFYRKGGPLDKDFGEIMEGFRPSPSNVTNSLLYELALVHFCRIPKIQTELDVWTERHYFKKYPLKDVLQSLENSC